MFDSRYLFVCCTATSDAERHDGIQWDDGGSRSTWQRSETFVCHRNFFISGSFCIAMPASSQPRCHHSTWKDLSLGCICIRSCLVVSSWLVIGWKDFSNEPCSESRRLSPEIPGWRISLQCSDTVGWVTGRTSGQQKHWMLVCWWWRFDWSFARLIAPVVTTHHFHHPLTGSPRFTWKMAVMTG